MQQRSSRLQIGRLARRESRALPRVSPAFQRFGELARHSPPMAAYGLFGGPVLSALFAVPGSSSGRHRSQPVLDVARSPCEVLFPSGGRPIRTASDRAPVGDFGSGQALSDDPHRLLEPLVPPPKPGGRPRSADMRRLLDGIFYVVRAGCQRRHLPPPSMFPTERGPRGWDAASLGWFGRHRRLSKNCEELPEVSETRLTRTESDGPLPDLQNGLPVTKGRTAHPPLRWLASAGADPAPAHVWCQACLDSFQASPAGAVPRSNGRKAYM